MNRRFPSGLSTLSALSREINKLKRRFCAVIPVPEHGVDLLEDVDPKRGLFGALGQESRRGEGRAKRLRVRKDERKRRPVGNLESAGDQTLIAAGA